MNLRASIVTLALMLGGCAGHPCIHADRSLHLSQDEAIRIADKFLLASGQTLTTEQSSKTRAYEWDRGGGWSVHYHLTDKELPVGPVVDVSNCTGEASFSDLNM